jgi:hypothetical protein
VKAAHADLGQVLDGFERAAEQAAIHAQRRAVRAAHAKVARHFAVLAASALGLRWAAAAGAAHVQPCVADWWGGWGGRRCVAAFTNSSAESSSNFCAAGGAPDGARVLPGRGLLVGRACGVAVALRSCQARGLVSTDQQVPKTGIPSLFSLDSARCPALFPNATYTSPLVFTLSTRRRQVRAAFEAVAHGKEQLDEFGVPSALLQIYSKV